jgi:hypothetical protein
MKPITYHYARETKGTWVYEARLGPGERISGSNQIYLLKAEFAKRPGDTITASFVVS